MKADSCIFPRGARSEALELRPKVIQKANATPITLCFIENRHEDLLVIFFRYLSDGLYAVPVGRPLSFSIMGPPPLRKRRDGLSVAALRSNGDLNPE